MQNDYVMRLVQQFVQAIFAIMHRRKSENYKEARALVRTTGSYLLKMDTNVLLFLSPTQALTHFKDFSGHIETEKCVLSADLFHELALIEEAEQKMGAPLHLQLLCLHLYTIALPKEKQFQTTEYFEKVSTLIEELRGKPLSPDVLESLQSYQEFLSLTSL